MLELKNITKTYTTAGINQNALSDVSLCFRKSEFVSILGQSGSGKTTLLNIIGGLDQYTSGDMIINGISTKKYKDRDWDNYRNHSIGFVFQSYNLIPHQTVLSNVELALTLSGISKSERKKRAEEALTMVGLGDQMRKKPNQMSGGQMQRVAIARALINNPDILLADEPTGALDSETSIQIMELLKEVSKDKLVIMVTHNPELAQTYSSRIITLLDGEITSDSCPYTFEEAEADLAREQAAAEADSASGKEAERAKKKKLSKNSMSFFTALSLSFNNLLTKKTRTILTSFAGSIGIIGIALILSVSTGFQMYIDRVQEDTLSSYPITINAAEMDLSSLISTLAKNSKDEESAHELDAVYESSMIYDLYNSFNSAEITRNNLTDFMKFVESDEELRKYLSAVQYSYNMNFNIFTKNKEGKVVKSDVMDLFASMMSSSSSSSETSSPLGSSSSFSSYNVWQEMLSGINGEIVNDTLKEQYDIIGGGRWPEAYDEIVIVVNERNEVSDLVLYALGLKTQKELFDKISAGQSGQIIEAETESWSYEEIMGLTFKLILNPEKYVKNADGTYSDLSLSPQGIDYMYGNDDIGVNLKVVGIIRQSRDAVSGMMSGSIGYTGALASYAIDKITNSDIVKAQLDNRDVDIISGLKFKPETETELKDEEKIVAVKEAIEKMSVSEKAALYRAFMSVPSEEYINSAVEMQLSTLDRATIESLMIAATAQQMGLTDTSSIEQYIKNMDDDTLYGIARESIRETVITTYSQKMTETFSKMTDEQLAFAFDKNVFTDEDYCNIYDNYLPSDYSEHSFSEVMIDMLGYVNKDFPSSIYLYATSFEDKDKISDAISRYNDGVKEEDKISYTDFVKLLMSSITTVINAITIVLTGFVAISLVVSSIMIGIITYISVLERTKEIGILRAVGASKKDVSRVFNAETLIEGFASGVMGIVITLILIIPLNLILLHFTNIVALKAVLPVAGAIVLVIISMLLTFIAGLIPSGIASKKNPVEALRTE